MELSEHRIKDRLEELARQDRNRKVFGSASHNYTLNPPLDVCEIEAFESKNGIQLPEDYRYFITVIGNGGAGPAYGLFPFGHDDEGRWGECLPIGDMGKPFPYDEAWNLNEAFWDGEPEIPEGMSEDEEERLLKEWDQRLEANYWNPAIMNGAIPICHLGCALRQWLIVHGEQRAFVWDDNRADHAGIAPVKDVNGKQATFTDWYLAWLDEAERADKVQGMDKASWSVRRPGSRLRDYATLALLVVAGLVVGLLLALF